MDFAAVPSILPTDVGRTENPSNAPEMRRCEQCFVEQPQSEFRRRSTKGDQRFSNCRTCHNAAERIRRQITRQRLTRRALGQRLSQMRREASASRVAALCEEMLRDCGGVAGFIRQWQHCLELDLTHGGYRAFRHFDSVVRLVQFCEDRKPNTHYRDMTDEQLEETAAIFGVTLQSGY
jgi:hypothetical protein